MNDSGDTPRWNDANSTPATPPNEAPMPKAASFRLRVFSPMALAAISSSRMAIQARPMRERSSRCDTTMAISTKARMR
jgi:hypothetical protein